MAFLEKLGGIARGIGDKATDAIETNKLNSKISSEKAAISECIRKIGDYYLKKHEAGEQDDPGVAELLAAIDGHNKTIADTQAEIARIQAENAAQAAQAAAAPAVSAVSATATEEIGCPACGKLNAPGTKFCCECGGKIEVPAPAEPAAAEEIGCPACGKLNPSGTKFCCECGGRMEIPAPAEPAAPVDRTCPGCGAQLPAASKFCGECGHRFE